MTELEYIPLGIGHAKEGVCFLLRMGPYRILCDCGLSDLRSLLSPPAPLVPASTSALAPEWPADFAICSHAHSDHARGILALHEAFPELPIYASDVTAHLLPLNWPSESEPQRIPNFCRSLPWRTPTELAPGLTVELYPAGHLPGASATLLTYAPQVSGADRAYTILYTGDFLLSNSRLVDGLPLSELRGMALDVLILEGSFGTARHPHRRQQENQFAERVMQALSQGRSVLIPVPMLGLAQELLMLMRSHHTFTGKNLDIWVEDSIARGCDAYLEILTSLPPTVQNFALHQALFWDERVRPRVRRLSAATSPARQTVGAGRSQRGDRPCIVLADESFDPRDYCGPTDRPWLILLPERPPQEDPAVVLGKTAPAAKQFSLKTFQAPSATSNWEPLLQSGILSIDTFLLAEHCDGAGTTQLIHNLRPQHVVLMHGSPAYLTDLIGLEELANRYHLHSPSTGNRLELPVGEGLIQPPTAAVIDAVFDGEIHELETEVIATLPRQLVDDPRWRSFADTGLIEAAWQGDLLVLRGISQRELLVQASRMRDSSLKCCARCKHYRARRCWNRQSSLYGSQVAPEGYCPVFEPSAQLAED
ncbi:MBL fold metallo-hydrolase [Altericista sp. CCNU0014]|uniref:MBL fold metallo-hydrolase n=1 Tax=Altericista sp. CCNU0014 TaxID=3082949 RepID=UPI003850BB20